jgi:hypothetical protein
MFPLYHTNKFVKYLKSYVPLTTYLNVESTALGRLFYLKRKKKIGLMVFTELQDQSLQSTFTL